MLFWILWFAIMGFIVYLFFRNEAACKYRLALLDEVGIASHADIYANPPRAWEWRLAEYDRVKYITMVLKFWKSFDSFYPEKGFTQIEGIDGNVS